MSKLIWKMADDSISSFSLLRLNVQKKNPTTIYLDGYVKCLANAVTFLLLKYSTSTTTYLINLKYIK